MDEAKDLKKTAKTPPADDPLARLVKADMPDGKMVVKPRCPLCNSPLRKNAEAMYDEGKPVTAIKDFLDAADPEGKITPAAITQHLREHYRDAVKMVRLMEYMDSLQAIRDRRQSRRDLIMSTVDINLVELSRVLPIQTNGDLAKEKERADIILKTINSIRDGEKMLMEMEGLEQEVESIQRKFINVWKAKIQSAKSEEEKQIYISTLQEFNRMLKGES